MRLIDDKVRLALTYIDVAARGGVPLSAQALDDFASRPAPAPARRQSSYLAAMREEMLSEYYYEPGEALSEFLLRAQWIEATEECVRLTDLGRVVLRHEERPQAERGTEGPLAVLINPEDRLAYLRLFGLIGGGGAGLLVDPYIRFEELFDLSELTRVNRVLTSNRVDKTGLRLKHLARVLGEIETTIEVRLLPPDRLHDRFYVPDRGDIYLLGSSLNSITTRPGVVAPISDPSASEALRVAYAGLWRSGADLLLSNRQDPSVGKSL